MDTNTYTWINQYDPAFVNDTRSTSGDIPVSGSPSASSSSDGSTTQSLPAIVGGTVGGVAFLIIAVGLTYKIYNQRVAARPTLSEHNAYNHAAFSQITEISIPSPVPQMFVPMSNLQYHNQTRESETGAVEICKSGTDMLDENSA